MSVLYVPYNKFNSLQIVKERKDGIADKIAIVDHLLQVADENDSFTLTDVKDESNTVMMAVCLHRILNLLAFY